MINFDYRNTTNGKKSKFGFANSFTLLSKVKSIISRVPSTQIVEVLDSATDITDGSSEGMVMNNTLQAYYNLGYRKIHITGVFQSGTAGAVTLPISEVLNTGVVASSPLYIPSGDGISLTATFDTTSTVTFTATGDDSSQQVIRVS